MWELLSRSNISVTSYGLGVDFGYVCTSCDIDSGDFSFGQGHDTPLGKGQQLCELLFRSNVTARSYGHDINFEYVCTVTLTLCEVSSSSNLPMKGYGLETNFCMCEPWPRLYGPESRSWYNCVSHPWVIILIDNNCMKYQSIKIQHDKKELRPW